MVRKFDREFEAGGHAQGFGRGQYRSRGGAAPGNQQGRHQSVEKPLRDRGEEAFPGTGHLSDRDEEVRRLRRELGRVTRERDILKKAVRIFSEGQ